MLSLACDTILNIPQEVFLFYPHRFQLFHSPQHSWGIRLFIKVPRSMSACIRFKVADRRYPVDECVFLIEENGKILFSDGTLTGGQAHIGKRAKDLLDKLDAFKKSEYAFGD